MSNGDDGPAPDRPDVSAAARAEPVSRLVAIMDRLRGPGGCPWDQEQDFVSIAPYTVEEAHEVADAIARADMRALREELGDLLLQVVFHARIAEDLGHFDLGDVARDICAKMIRRHPHVFGGDSGPADAARVRATWEEQKAREKVRASVLDDVPPSLPALQRAAKLSARAGRTGFDWPDASGPRAKVIEEIAELDSATTDDERTEEAGDLLFAMANWCRHLGIEPENALRLACLKFERRFRTIEQHHGFKTLTLEAKERLWKGQP